MKESKRNANSPAAWRFPTPMVMAVVVVLVAGGV
jgi:hypothetical protein